MARLRTLSQRLYALSTGWVTAIALGIFALFMIVVLPAQASRSAATAGTGETPDTQFTYSADELYALADALGDAGRTAYIRARFTFDIIWPLVYLLFLTTAISWLARQGIPENSRWRMVNLLPLAAALFDLLENLATSLVMGRYPAATPGVAELAGLFTLLKWILVGTSFLALAVVLVAALIQWVRKRQTR